MRQPVQKTWKLYMNGAFKRSESGRVASVTDARGGTMSACLASRKDLRDTIKAMRAAQGPWAGRTAFNRGQILYRLGEMIEGRAGSWTVPDADWQEAADRAVFHAGWCDKIGAVLSTLNPVGASYVNYSRVRPLGIVVAFPRAEDGLTGLVEAACAATIMGNAVTVVVPTALVEVATGFAECLATCDMPGGVVNVLTGDVEELLGHAVRHDDLDALYLGRGAVSQQALVDADEEGSRVLRRKLVVDGASRPAEPDGLVQLSEIQTVWISASEAVRPAGAGY